MIDIRIIEPAQKSDINIPNEPFRLFGRIRVSYADGKWTYHLERYAAENIREMCFPAENYDYDAMPGSIFLGAYDDGKCVGLAILQPGFFRYMYLSDLKVNREYRGQHIGKRLLEKAGEIAASQGYRGIYTIGQDDNPGACLFYLHTGFYIGGLDTNVYRHTGQEGKADIIFYREQDSSIPK